jgi:hypothetical protein
MNLLEDLFPDLTIYAALLFLFALVVMIVILALTIDDIENWVKSKWSKNMKD